ncbi:MAG: 8-amino-7-oxononanoate synthase [Verrucomicrobiota bacterium]
MTAESNSFEQDLAARIEDLRRQELYRELRRVDSPQSARLHWDGREYLNFSSNDYLGLATHPALREAARQAIAEFGAGAGASRLISGSLAPFHQLEETLAQFKGTEAALSFATGSAAALGTITSLVGKGDFIVIDKLVHASIVDAARLSGARLRVFAHNDLDDLDQILAWVARQSSKPRTLVVTESLFSMDGDQAPLRELVDLKDRHGAWLMIDEAHALGLFGPRRRGLAEHCGVADRIEIQMGTLGKAAGASGGFICGSRRLVDFLVNRARSFIFSTAPVPAAAAAARAGIELIAGPEGERRCADLWDRVAQLGRHPAPIVPVVVGSESAALDCAARLRERGMFVLAIRYPTVARGQARLRITLTAAHTPADVQALSDALREFCPDASKPDRQ